MRGHVGAIETLRHACMAHRMLWVLCKACGHAHKLDPRNLTLLLGELSLRALQTRLTCRRCGRRRAAILVDDREWPHKRG
jgi:hypothetical protein